MSERKLHVLQGNSCALRNVSGERPRLEVLPGGRFDRGSNIKHAGSAIVALVAPDRVNTLRPGEERESEEVKTEKFDDANLGEVLSRLDFLAEVELEASPLTECFDVNMARMHLIARNAVELYDPGYYSGDHYSYVQERFILGENATAQEHKRLTDTAIVYQDALGWFADAVEKQLDKPRPPEVAEFQLRYPSSLWDHEEARFVTHLVQGVGKLMELSSSRFRPPLTRCDVVNRLRSYRREVIAAAELGDVDRLSDVRLAQAWSSYISEHQWGR